MFNNLMFEVKQTKEIKVFLPEQCPFRVFAFNQYNHEGDFCALLSTETKTTFWREDCCSTNKQWIEGCPLLKDDFKITKN